MSKKSTSPERLKVWVEAQRRYQLSNAHVTMARELGMNPKKFGSIANDKQEPWKVPLPDFIVGLYECRFNRTSPLKVTSVAAVLRKQEQDRKARKAEHLARKRAIASATESTHDE
jgi:hypothetical protein